MSGEPLEALAAELRAGATPAGVEILKRNSARVAARAGDVALKVYLARPETAAREARALTSAQARGLAVPELVASGPDWTATRWLGRARAASRADLPLLLRAAADLHARGVLHGDLHLGNLLVQDGAVIFLDLQRARFLPWLPRLLRARERGFLAYSLGEPLPPELESVRFWRDRRAQRHWRSRTARCLEESGGFAAFQRAGAHGFRRRDADPAALAARLDELATATPFKATAGSELYRAGPWIAKRFAREADARRAWVGGNGLEVRGIATGRALAWVGPWLVMEDGGATVTDWVDGGGFAAASEAERAELARALGSLVARLHRRGVYHADLKANNVLWRPGAEPRLLDYGAVRFAASVPRRRRVKNLAQLNAALPDLVPASLREAALASYLAESGCADDPARLRRDVVTASVRRRHRWSGC